MDYVAKFEAIAEAATKEGTLEKSLERMHRDWEEISFTVNPYRDTGTYVIASVDEIQILLDDHLIKTQTMKNSLYIKPFEKETLLVVVFFLSFLLLLFFSINNDSMRTPITILCHLENGRPNYYCYKTSWIIG